MLLSANSLRGYAVLAKDGAIGTVRDFLFHDRTWLIRYFVVDTGNWLTGRRVLVSPYAFEQPNWQADAIPTNLTKEQVANSPDIDVEKPVSRQHERALQEHYLWPAVWPGGALPFPPPAAVEDKEHEPETGSQHLRSVREVTGYAVEATDGAIGHVEDFIVEEGTAIRYLVIETRNWLPGKRVLVAAQWIHGVSWEGKSVSTDLRREEVKDSPEYDPSAPVNRQVEERLYDFYGRPKYWQ